MSWVPGHLYKFKQCGVEVYPGRCTGCSRCRTVCPKKEVLGQSEDGIIYVAAEEQCIACLKCVDACAYKAILPMANAKSSGTTYETEKLARHGSIKKSRGTEEFGSRKD